MDRSENSMVRLGSLELGTVIFWHAILAHRLTEDWLCSFPEPISA